MGARSYWCAPVPPLNSTDGTPYASSITLSDVSPAPQIALPPDLLELGTTLRIHARGQYSTTGSPTLILGLYYGGVAGAALAASTAFTVGTTAAAWPWEIDYRGEVRALGSSGSINGHGRILIAGAAGSLSSYNVTRAIPETAAGRTVTVDTTTRKTVTVGAQWGTSSASNTLTCNDLIVELLG